MIASKENAIKRSKNWTLVCFSIYLFERDFAVMLMVQYYSLCSVVYKMFDLLFEMELVLKLFRYLNRELNIGHNFLLNSSNI